MEGSWKKHRIKREKNLFLVGADVRTGITGFSVASKVLTLLFAGLIVMVFIKWPLSYVLTEIFKKSKAFEIITIQPVGNKYVHDHEIIRDSKIKHGISLFAINVEEIKKSILADKRIKKVEIVRSLFHTIKIKVEERQPVAFAPGSFLKGLDVDGVEFTLADFQLRESLPFLTGAKNVTEVLRADRYAKVAESLQKLKQENESVYKMISEINVDVYPELKVYLVGSNTLIRTRASDFVSRIVEVKAILKELERKNEEASYIDSRFEGRAIVGRIRKIRF